MERDLKTVEELYRAFARRDLRKILLLTSRDIEIDQSPELPWGGHYSGHEGLQQFFAKLLEHVDSNVIPERLVDAGDKIALLGRTVGKACATGLEFDIPVVHIWTFREGVAVRFEPHIDNPTMLAALGQLI